MDIKILLLIGIIVVLGLFIIFDFFIIEKAGDEDNVLFDGPLISIYNWEDYLSEEIVAEFEEKYAVTVILDYFEDSDDVLISLRQDPGVYDIFIVDDDYVDYFRQIKLLKELDHQRIPNLKNIKKDALKNSVDEEMQYCIPYVSGYTAVVINSSYIENYNGLRDIFWNKDYRGKITMPNNAMEILINSIYYLGYNPEEITHEQLLEAEEKSMELLEMDILFGDPVQQRNWLVNGDALVGYIYSTEVAFIQEDNENIDFFAPEEGVYLWSDWICVSKDTGGIDVVYLFLDYLYDLEIMARNSEDIYSIMPGIGIEDHIDNEVLEMVDGLNFPKKQEILNRSTRINYSSWNEAQEVLSNITRELKIRE